VAQGDGASASEKDASKTPNANIEAGASDESAASRNPVIIADLAHRATSDPELADKLKSAKASDLKDWGIEGMTLAAFRKALSTTQDTIGRTKMATEQSSSSSGATVGTGGSVCGTAGTAGTASICFGAAGGNVASGGSLGTAGSVCGSLGTAGTAGICFGAAGSTPVGSGATDGTGFSVCGTAGTAGTASIGGTVGTASTIGGCAGTVATVKLCF